MTSDLGARRLSPSDLDEHWDRNAAVIVHLPGDPELDIRIDKPADRLTLRAEVPAGAPVPVSGLMNVELNSVVEGGVAFVEIATVGKELLHDGYAMLMTVADRIQLDGSPPFEALEETLALWEAILASRARLGTEVEVGLFGELLLLEGLVKAGVARADAWRGGLREEHDFGFAKADIEVKTTSGEHRQHRINGLGQLQETEGSSLWLVSIQITRGGDGQGRTLPELIDEVRDLGGSAGRPKIDENLAGTGWQDAQRDLFWDAWRIRSRPLLLRVDGSFPRITRELISELQVDTARVREVDYVLDVADLPEAEDPPPEMAQAISEMEVSSG
ncbi:MAG TPA: PD-(D/E)XK motif protein [Solirubrobacterales bacterium]